MTQLTKLSTWANNIAPSPTLAVDAKAKELKAAGEDVCGFGAGEPDFDTPEFIKEACIQAIQEGKTKYAPAPGIPALREALAEKYRNQGVDGTTAAQCVVSPGGKYSCYLAILAVISPGDEVVIPAPYWVSYPEMVKLAGGIPKTIFAGLEDGFKITPEQLREAITPKTRLVIINSPSNPTGAIYSAKYYGARRPSGKRESANIFPDEAAYQLIAWEHPEAFFVDSEHDAIAQDLPDYSYYDDFGMVISRGKQESPFSIAIKAGHNAENHNHSDVGTYTIILERDFVVGESQTSVILNPWI